MDTLGLSSNFLLDAQITRNAEITPKRKPFIADFSHKFVNFGSCFAQSIKRILDTFGFETFFVSEICAHYNTETLAAVLEVAADGRAPAAEDILRIDDKSYAFRHHFKFPFVGVDSETAALQRLAPMFDALRAAIIEADTFIVTLGTSRIIRLKANGQALAVAARLDREHWDLDLLDVAQNVSNLRRLCAAIMRIRGARAANLVLTVSPQRYLFGHVFEEGAEGHEGVALVDNFLSKCNLRVAAQEIVSDAPAGFNVHYFPAFEIVVEELRPFESIAHYDYCHISQQHTPELVVKKFLLAHAAENILAQLSATTRINSIWGEIAKLRRGGLPPSDAQISTKLAKIEAELDEFGDDLSGPLLNFRFQLLTEYGRPLSRIRYRFERPNNLNSLARILAAVGRPSEADTVLQQVIEHVGPRRTEDPESGATVEHQAYNEAVALRNSFTQAVR